MAGYALPGNQLFVDKLEAMTARAANPKPVFESMIVTFHQVEEAKFNASGPGWAPLSPLTMATKDREGYGDEPTLVRTHDLWDSLIGVGSDHFQRVTPFGWESGTTLPYASFHQTGTTHGRETMPARPVVDLTPGVIVLFTEMMSSYITHGNANKFPGKSRIGGAI